MSALQLTIAPYRLPLRHPWETATGTLTERRGWLVRAEQDGLTGWGDCAPLLAAGTESPAAARARLSEWQARAAAEPPADLLTALAPEDNTPHGRPRGPIETPAADCAVETALLDLAARQGDLPLRRLLAADAPDQVRVNGMLGPAVAVTDAALDAALAAGWQVLKCKLGLAPVATEAAALARLAARLPAGVWLRLDANGAWSADEATWMLDALAGLPVESLEEPLREPTDAALGRLQARAGFALALDESLWDRPRPLHLSALPVRRLVLKPGVVGGLRLTLALAIRASVANREVVLTSLVESAAGVWATAHLAAAIAGPRTHGLGTSAWLAADLGAAPPIQAGRLLLPAEAGSGFRPADDGHEPDRTEPQQAPGVRCDTDGPERQVRASDAPPH